MLKVEFEHTLEPYGTYRDAIVYEEGSLTPEQIEAEKLARIDAWLALVTPQDDSQE